MTLKCLNCGIDVVPRDDRFCPICGRDLLAQPPSSPEEAAAEKVEAAPAAEEHRPAPAPSGFASVRIQMVIGPTGRTINLAGKQEYLIGRMDPAKGIMPDADLTPFGGDNAGVSRRHAKIVVRDQSVFFVDLQSLNGSWVNKVPAPPGQQLLLVDGAELRLGRLEVRLCIDWRGTGSRDAAA